VDQLACSSRVEMPGMIPHDELIEEYRQADVALDLMGHNYERELAFTTRTVEYLWCGLPVIYNDYAELSAYIREYEAGWVVNPTDESQVRQAIAEALNNPHEVHRRGENAQRLVRERLTWDKTIEPLDSFCRAPWRRDPAYVPELFTDGQRQPPAPPPDDAKSLRELFEEARFHYHHGGVRRLAYYTLGFLQKRLNQTGDSNL